MEIIPNGTKVLIFKYIKGWREQNEKDYITGIIQSSEQSHDLSHHGSSWYVQIYKVLGEDGKIYRGTYGSGLIGDYFFRTKEYHISILEKRINDNEKEISKIKEKNANYLAEITNLKNKLTSHEQGETELTRKLIPKK